MREAFFPAFAHIYGIVSGVLVPAWIGSYVQPMKKFEYLPYLSRASELKANILRLVPAAAVRMTKDPDVKKLDLSSVHTIMCSGAPLSDETVKALQNILSPEANILNGYGMSEATLTLLRNTRGNKKSASVGKPAAGMELRVVDENYKDVPVGTDGECLVRGPCVFMEYKSNQAETEEAFRDGWLCTGDVVHVDEEGYFWLTGRKKELIKYKGNQIAPAELEAVLLSHPDVLDAGVCKYVAHVFKTAIGSCNDDIDKQCNVLRRIKESLIKTSMIFGIPRVINAFRALVVALPPGLAPETPSIRATIKLPTPETSARGLDRMRTIFRADLDPFLDLMDTNWPDLRTLVVDIIYGYYQADNSVIDPVTTSALNLAALVPMDVTAEVAWHMRGLVRNGGSEEQLHHVMNTVKEIVKICQVGLKNTLPKPEDVIREAHLF
ncbi:hypothetical protein ACHAQA_006215 [Verticillium albo-atrum]